MYRHSEYRGACHCITKWGMLRRLQLQRNDLYGGRDRACRVFSARRAFISRHNGRRMPSLLAITDNGSERAVCKPACWASYCCLCKCQIPALELGPLLACLNQSSICAVESTWSSCLLLGKTSARGGSRRVSPLSRAAGRNRSRSSRSGHAGSRRSDPRVTRVTVHRG